MLRSRVEEGTLLERLPPELKEELYQRTYRCGFAVTFEPDPLDPGKPMLVFTQGILRHEVYLDPTRVTKGNVSKLIEAIKAGEERMLEIGDVDIHYIPDENSINVRPRSSTTSFPPCIEFIEAMQRFHDSL